MQYPYSRGSSPQRNSFWFFIWFLLIAPVALAQQTLVKDIISGTGSSNPTSFTNVNGTLYFSTSYGNQDGALFKSDGTDAGTVQVRRFPAGKPSELTSLNGTVFFTANDGVSGQELWKSNGTAAGTVLVKDLNPGPANGLVFELTTSGGELFFTTNYGLLWKSDGTAAGTERLMDAGGSLQYAQASGLTDVNGTLFFITSGEENSYALWKSDGTSAGTTQVKQWTGASDMPTALRNIDGKLYFTFFYGRSYEFWRSDGTPEGTVQVGDFGGRFDNGGDPTSVNGIIYFSAYNTDLYKLVGSGQVLAARFPFGGPAISDLTNVSGTLFFRVGNELWKLTETGSPVKVRDLPFENNGSLWFTAAAGKLYFSGQEAGSTAPPTLWVSDGTYAGTKPVPASSAGTPTNPEFLTTINGRLYYSAVTAALGRELWRHNPADLPDGTLRLNAGGAVYKRTADGITFAADNSFTGGKATTYVSGEVANTTDDELYRTGRFGEGFSYSLPSGKGYFDVILHFNETYWGNGRSGGAGSRKFNVDVEGQRKLTEYDIFAKAGGAMRAVKETFTVAVSDGTLNIAFLNGSADLPRVAAIEVIPSRTVNQGPTLSNLPNELTATVGQTLTFTATGSDPDGNSLKYSLIQAPNDEPIPTGATIDPATGVFTWKPTQPGNYAFGVVVTDNGLPAMSDQAFTSIYVTGCTTPRTDLPVVGSTYCNVVSGTSGFEGTVTVKNSQPGVGYEVWGGRGSYQSYTPRQTGNGGDLVFTFQFAFQVNAPDMYSFDVKAYGCSEVTLAQKAQITLVAPLSAPDAAGKTISSGQTATLTAAGDPAGASFRWYSAPSGGTPLFTGATFTTPALTATTSYYVSIASNGCEGPRKQVTVTVSGTGSATAFRVNAGGNSFSTIDSRSFSGDAYFSGGVVSTTTNLDIAGTADDYLYQTGRHGASFAYNFPSGNGAFDVVLHFAETYWGNTAPGGVGSRRFHVDIEGARKLTDYDIFAKAGGALRVAQQTFRVNVTDGTLNVNFLKGLADNPAIKAIEVLPAGLGLAVNSGGAAFTAGSGKVFASDVYFAQGSVSSISSGEIANTSDDALYRNARFGPAFSYGLPSGNGTYDVVLHFAETYWGARAAGGAGSRRFDVYVEGTKRLTEYDIFAKAGGAMRAVRETVRVTVSDGVLNLYFAKGSADNAIVSAIEVVPVEGSARIAHEQTAAEDWQVRLYPNPVADKLTVKLPFSAAQVKATAVTDAAGAVRLSNTHKTVGQDQLQLEAGALSKGFYLLRLDTEQGSKVVKFFKQ